jgi:hypothetical protein
MRRSRDRARTGDDREAQVARGDGRGRRGRVAQGNVADELRSEIAAIDAAVAGLGFDRSRNEAEPEPESRRALRRTRR